jgi:Ca-activated chloride channel family protein
VSSISVTSVGVGLEYNENLMLHLAEGGGGNYYFVENASDLASLFRKEFHGMVNLVAQNARLEFTPARGVRVVDIVGYEYAVEGNRYAVAVGDLCAADRRDITVVLDVPGGRGYRTLASAVLKYAAEGGPELASNPVTVGVRYTRDVAEVDRHRDMKVQAQSEVAVSTRRVEEALQALDRGDKDEAVGRLQEVQRELAASPAASAGGDAAVILREQETKLKAYTDTLMQKDGNEVRAKKSIQYENYRVQKKK